MNVLVFGQTGQVAQELALLDGVTCVGRGQADLTDATACVATIKRYAPDAVINAAAYTAVDKAEEDAALAHVVNSDAPTAMAQACAALDIPFVQISTDYVFAGDGIAPWQPDDPTGPLGVYGASKLAGEKGVLRAGGTHAILRTSWVFSAHGNNFVKTMLRLGAERDALTIVADQIGGPTAARDIAVVCHLMARQLIEGPDKTGTYHFSGAEDCSWADFATEIFAQAGLTCAVTGIPSTDYPTPAARPLNSRMDCSTTTSVFGIKRPDWKVSLAAVLADLS